MANKSINSLPNASSLANEDLLVLWQSSTNSAKNMTGAQFAAWLTAIADGHGGIASISWSSSGTPGDGETHTATIHYADGSTSTFSIQDGVKGDTGAQTYVYVRFSDEEPTSDAEIGTIPAPWMGIYVGLEDDPANLHYTDYVWYEIKGEKGDTGEGVNGVARTSGDGAPGTTDEYTMYANGTPIGQFYVYNGMNGTGAVGSVSGVYPDANGNVPLTEEDIPHRTLEDSTILLIGDSYNYGTGGVAGRGWGYYFNSQNGTSATIIHQDGGGFAAVGNTDAQYPNMTYADVIGQLSSTPAYDLVIAQAGWNDASTSRNTGGAAAIVTGVNAFVSAVQTKWPKAEIIILPTNNGTACTADKLARLAAISDTAFDNYVRSTSRSFTWMNGKGYASGDAHLTDAGYQLLAQLITRFAKGWDGVTPFSPVMTATVTGTTNSGAQLDLTSTIAKTDVILALRVTSDTGLMAIPWRYASQGQWYALIMNWNQHTYIANTSVTVEITYITQ